MRRVFKFCCVVFLGVAVVISVSVLVSSEFSFQDISKLTASIFFVDSVTADSLKAKYRNSLSGDEKIKILIVAGHDNKFWGTDFRGVREADMNLSVGEELFRLLSAEGHYSPVLLRTREGYAGWFEEYFAKELESIKAFVVNRKKIMTDLISTNMVSREQEVFHNKAPAETVWRLYAINRWANENFVDIVLHLHFNDYPGRGAKKQGRYEGFSFYVPEGQFSNSKASMALAESLLSRFSKFYANSDFPFESAGIVQDQDLIAVGAFNTLDPAAVLIEYGYIYEHRFLDEKIRELFMKELAFQTYLGLDSFFGASEESLRKIESTFLPYKWSEPISQGNQNKHSVLSMQMALLLDGLYPPDGNKKECPLTGVFGSCTARSVAMFQEKYGIEKTSGVAGWETINKLNELYGH